MRSRQIPAISSVPADFSLYIFKDLLSKILGQMGQLLESPLPIR